MKTDASLRTHVSLDTSDLDRALAFYRALFGVEPVLLRRDYARFATADPGLVLGLNAVARRHEGRSPLEHLGILFPDDAALDAVRSRLERAGFALEEEPDVVCCYARLARAWARDPDGVPWELFVAREEVVESPSRSGDPGGICCAEDCCA